MTGIYKRLKRVIIVSLFLVLAGNMVFITKAEEEQQDRKVVRVGWYDSSYNTLDPSGRRSGYAYEYQLKLSAYNGWSYEYVGGSWSDLLHMLETGDIDLMSDVSYTEERTEYMLYPSLPMGTEEYYLFTAPGNEEITPASVATLNGKRVGVNEDSIQAEFYEEWAKNHHVHSDVVLVNCTENESLEMLEKGELDAYVTVDSFMDPTRAVPVYKIGSSDYYFAVSKNRPDLLDDLNFAMGRIQDENRYYNQQMYEKFIRRAGANAFLTSAETEWIKEHGPIRVGYQDNYMAFCSKDKETGELTGVLKDYLALAADCMPNAHLDFETSDYPTIEDAMIALDKGEIDCVFPANLSGYDAENKGAAMTPPLMNTDMYAVVRVSDPYLFNKEGQVIAAVNRGNLNYEAFLMEHYPSWGKVIYKDTQECLKGVANGEADCLIISNYRYNNISRLCDKYHLTTFSLGQQMDYCFAVSKGQTELYSILAKTTSMIPASSVNAALSHYITADAKQTLMDFLSDNLPVVLIITGVVVLVILGLLIMNMRAVKRAKLLISATETDDLTGLYNRKYFFQYADRRFHDSKEGPMDAIVLNIEQFHSINALHGRKLGDQILRELGNEIRSVAAENNGIAGRFESDRFDIYCRHLEEYRSIYDRLQAKLDETAPNTNVRLRMGVMPWQADLEPVQLFDRARTACNMARGHYKEHLIIYDRKVSERESYEQRLIHDLRSGLKNGEFEVFYQPKYDIQSEEPKLISTEALVRWNHPELGMIPPGDFIPLFERNGQIRLLDQFVWSEAAAQIAEWRDKYNVMLPVSVNLSRVDVFDPNLEQTLDEILEKNHLGYADMKLEVTESAYTENADQVIQVVENLRRKGYEVEMDDFGSGYSSLSMLSAMPVDVLKMDREFIRNIEQEEKDLQLVALILDIARNLKVPVIAEGVETQAQLELLKKLGCEVVQGYYFSRPLKADEFEQTLLRKKKK